MQKLNPPLLGLFVILIIFLGSFYLYQFLLSAPSKDATQEMFVIPKDESSSSITSRLEEKGFIKNSLVFQIYLWRQSLADKIQAGDFKLSRNLEASVLTQILIHGTIDRWITIIEGWRAEEVAEYLRKALPETADYQNDAQYKRVIFDKVDPYLAAVASHEGYLFPDTYLIPKNASASAVIAILLANFEKKFDQSLQEDAQKAGLTREEVVILASIVEREAKFENDRPIVAGILLKRLKLGIPLQIDATVQYALGYQKKEKAWWKKKLTKADLTINSPHNTYKFRGLPPRPISNPGLASIRAVVYSQKTDDLFYLSDKEGKMHYAKTLEEHNENIKKYL